MKFTLIAFLSLLFGACQPTDFVKTISAEEFAQYITEEGVQLLDVRTPEEYAEGHLEGAVLIDFKADGFVEKAEAQLQKDKPVALYCRGGRRSHSARNFRKTNLLLFIVVVDVVATQLLNY